jgi:alkylation response protein AidB-like acyl-CoA dehydrogenase
MQNTKFAMAEMYAKMTAAHELNQACVRAMVAGEDATELISMAKLFTMRTCCEIADGCMQLHGGFGFMKESMAGRAFVDLRMARIGGGSDETMLHYLSNRLGL